MCTVWHTSPVKTWADMLQRAASSSARSGAGSQMDIYPAMLNKLFGTKIKVIGGYKDGGLDLPRDGARGDRRPLRPAAHRDQIAAPAMADRAQDRGCRSWSARSAAPIFLMRQRSWSSPRTSRPGSSAAADRHAGPGSPAAAPPGVPAERVKVLRDAFNATMADPAFRADIEQDAAARSIWVAARRWRANSRAPMRCRADVVAAAKETMAGK